MNDLQRYLVEEFVEDYEEGRITRRQALKLLPLNGAAHMGSPTLDKIRTEALSLPEAERAELAHNLVASLDGPADPDVESAWDADILRKFAEIDSGTANRIDREELGRCMRTPMSRS